MARDVKEIRTEPVLLPRGAGGECEERWSLFDKECELILLPGKQRHEFSVLLSLLFLSSLLSPSLPPRPVSSAGNSLFLA